MRYANINKSKFLSIKEELKGTYSLVYDAKAGEYTLTKRRQKTDVLLQVIKCIEKDLRQSYATIKEKIKCDKHSKYICKSTLIKMVGRKIAETIKPNLEVKNPYYKCSDNMLLYHLDSLLLVVPVEKRELVINYITSKGK